LLETSFPNIYFLLMVFTGVSLDVYLDKWESTVEKHDDAKIYLMRNAIYE